MLRRFFKQLFPPPSLTKHIKAVLAQRHGSMESNEAAIPKGKEVSEAAGLDKSFRFLKKFYDKYELEKEVGKGHFGYTCRAKFKKGELKGQEVVVKVIPKAKMTTAIAIEDVRKEVYYTGFPKDLGPSRVVHFTSERKFAQLLHQGHPVVYYQYQV